MSDSSVDLRCQTLARWVSEGKIDVPKFLTSERAEAVSETWTSPYGGFFYMFICIYLIFFYIINLLLYPVCLTWHYTFNFCVDVLVFILLFINLFTSYIYYYSLSHSNPTSLQIENDDSVPSVSAWRVLLTDWLKCPMSYQWR